MEKYIEKLNSLLQKGKHFNYDNFSTKTINGNTSSIESDYISWRIKVGSLLLSIFGKESPIYTSYLKGENARLKGFGEGSFNSAHSQILGAIDASIDNLKFEPEKSDEGEIKVKNNKVFIVHGHDENLKHQLEIFLSEIGLEPIVLHRQADEGQTIIEKFERHSEVSYVFILLTPDEIAYLMSEDNKEDDEREKEFRARPNVIFEFGYFAAKLGRNRVCCLYKEGVTLPTDVSGMIYKQINNNIEEQAFSILKDLKANGFIVNI